MTAPSAKRPSAIASDTALEILELTRDFEVTKERAQLAQREYLQAKSRLHAAVQRYRAVAS